MKKFLRPFRNTLFILYFLLVLCALCGAQDFYGPDDRDDEIEALTKYKQWLSAELTRLYERLSTETEPADDVIAEYARLLQIYYKIDRYLKRLRTYQYYLVPLSELPARPL